MGEKDNIFIILGYLNSIVFFIKKGVAQHTVKRIEIKLEKQKIEFLDVVY